MIKGSEGSHVIHHSDILRNDTQYNGLNVALSLTSTQHNVILSVATVIPIVVMLSVILLNFFPHPYPRESVQAWRKQS